MKQNKRTKKQTSNQTNKQNKEIAKDAGKARGKQLKRLDVDSLKLYYWAEGQEHMFLKHDCQMELSTGAVATCVYVMPKYTSRYGKENGIDS